MKLINPAADHNYSDEDDQSSDDHPRDGVVSLGLNPASQAWLVHNVQVRINAHLTNPLTPDLPPGATDYDLEFILPWHPSEGTGYPGLDARLQAVTNPEQNPDTGHIDVRVGSATCVVLNRNSPNLLDAVDSRNQELTFLFETLFSDDDLKPELEAQLGNSGASYVILIEYLEIDPVWTPTSVGAAALGIALQELGRGCAFAAIGLYDEEPETTTTAALLGFTPITDKVHLLDLAMTTLDNALNKLWAST